MAYLGRNNLRDDGRVVSLNPPVLTNSESWTKQKVTVKVITVSEK